ncbi:MAG: acyltransferase family protein [Dysgonamonadaceae bacterium]|jgi:fucose 4-O-acetylase-like acetyltransferase|nr:acyltransferase family protein [Dysgonamonadaceae bacterium]
MKSTETRYQWIDYAKFASIFLIVFFHSPPPLTGFAGVMLFHLRLPSFFFVAGLLFGFERHPSFTEFLRHRGKQLLTPYFCFFIIFYAYWLLIGKSMSPPEEQAAPFYRPLFECLYGRPELVCVPLWFLACLFVLQLSFYLFRRVENRCVTMLILVAVSLLPSFIDLSRSPWMIENVCFYLPFYGFASLYKKEIIRLMDDKRRFAVAPVMLALHVACNFAYSGVENETLKSAFRLAGGFAVIVPFFILIKLMGERKLPAIIRYIGANTVITLACHTYGISLLTLAGRYIHIINTFVAEFPYLSKFLTSVIVLLAMLAPIYFVNRYLPFVIGREKKQRT